MKQSVQGGNERERERGRQKRKTIKTKREKIYGNGVREMGREVREIE